MDIINCGLFMFPKLTKKYWYFAGFILASFFRFMVPNLLDLYKKDLGNGNDQLKKLLAKNYFELLRNILSDLIIGIFHCVDYVRNKDEYKKRNEFQYNKNASKINFIFTNEKRRNFRMFKIIFIISLIDIVCQLSLPIKYCIESLKGKEFITLSAEHLNSFLLIDILSRYFLSLWILKTYFYAHHYFSLFINFISLLPLVVIDSMYKYQYYKILYISIIGLKIILYSLEDIINKVAFSTLYILPNTLIFYKGLFEFVVYLPAITILFVVFRLYEIVSIEFLENEGFIFISFIPFNILRTLCLVYVIDRFTAQHMSFLKVSEAISIYYFIYVEEKKIPKIFPKLEEWALIVQLICFIFLLISSLIHNEIIIINCPTLKAKTEFYLDKDADREQNSSCYSDTLFSDSIEINSTDGSNLYSDLTGSDIS